MRSYIFVNSVIHVVVECPCGFVVKCKCIYLYQLQYCNIACVLDYRALSLYCIKVDGTVTVPGILLLTYLIMY